MKPRVEENNKDQLPEEAETNAEFKGELKLIKEVFADTDYLVRAWGFTHLFEQYVTKNMPDDFDYNRMLQELGILYPSPLTVVDIYKIFKRLDRKWHLTVSSRSQWTEEGSHPFDEALQIIRDLIEAILDYLDSHTVQRLSISDSDKRMISDVTNRGYEFLRRYEDEHDMK